MGLVSAPYVGLIALMLVLITVRLYAFTSGSLDVEVTNTPHVEIENRSLNVEVTNTPLEVTVVR